MPKKPRTYLGAPEWLRTGKITKRQRQANKYWGSLTMSSDLPWTGLQMGKKPKKRKRKKWSWV